MRNFVICFDYTQWEVFFQIKFHSGMKFYSFHPRMKLTCKQKFFHPRTSFIPGWDFISVSCKRTLRLKIPCISESCIEIEIKLNFYFDTSLCCLKRFHEGLHKTFWVTTSLHETFWGTTKKCKNKNLTWFFFFARDC